MDLFSLFFDAVNGIADFVGLGNALGSLEYDIMNPNERINPDQLSNILNKALNKAKNTSETQYENMLNQIARLSSIAPSPALKRTIQNTIEAKKDKVKAFKQKLSKAQTLEDTAKVAMTNLQSMNKRDLVGNAGKQQYDIFNKALNSAKEAYEETDKNSNERRI